jgi:hypothetical protein
VNTKPLYAVSTTVSNCLFASIKTTFASLGACDLALEEPNVRTTSCKYSCCGRRTFQKRWISFSLPPRSSLSKALASKLEQREILMHKNISNHKDQKKDLGGVYRSSCKTTPKSTFLYCSPLAVTVANCHTI